MKRVLVTGAAGFIGSWTASAFAGRGDEVLAIDNFSRRGNDENSAWLTARHGLKIQRLDVRDADAVEGTVKAFVPDVIVHLAAQVAVTTSVTHPRLDFETNALGTFNVLESTRKFAPESIFIFASTNKVYGGLSDAFQEPSVDGQRYSLPHPASQGVSESHPLDFHSPYGCSKGAADQYVRDYSRIFGLRTFTFRQSCIYGPRQFGIEDQGWVAWFVIAALLGKQVSVFGTGNQVRDLLHVDDLVNLYLRTADQTMVASGVYNVGGGPRRTMSLLELIDYLLSRGINIQPSFAEERPGDQAIFVSDISRVSRDLGWEPTKMVATGVDELIDWVQSNRDVVTRVLEVQ